MVLMMRTMRLCWGDDMKKHLSIDLETYSDIPIDFGVAKYVDTDAFRILLFGYAYDDGPVQVVDLAKGEEMPADLLRALFSPDVLKTAYNANFEMTCLAKHFKREIDFDQWQCSSVLALSLGLPGSLAKVAKALRFPEDKQKIATGKRLINIFCKPKKENPDKKLSPLWKEAPYNRPDDFPEHWELFKEYCRQDVEVERSIYERLCKYNPNATEQKLWSLDQHITRCGVMIDTTLAANAIKFDAEIKRKATKELKRLTGVSNPGSNSQLKTWLEYKLGVKLPSIDKEAVKALLATNLDVDIKRVLLYKQLISKTSVKKYQAMLASVCSDDRLHGMLQFHGSRTGRWAGRLVQVHNLPQNHLVTLDTVRELLRGGDFDAIEMLYDKPSDVLSQLIRTAFIARPGCRFIVADFSAIEARVIAWLAGEKWRQEVFAQGGDIYCASASAMFHVPVVKHGVNGDLRQKGKVAELALGYQGGPGALKNMGALKMGLKEAELQGIVDKWRTASPKIVKLWGDVEALAKLAINTKGTYAYKLGISFSYVDQMLLIRLPSGRHIAYVRPQMGANRWGKPSITYEGTGQQGGWCQLETYGGKLTENIVQAIARDCLAEAMLRLDEAGYTIVFHVHDEVILEVPNDTGSLEEAIKIMTINTKWNQGLKLDADGYETVYYRKD